MPGYFECAHLGQQENQVSMALYVLGDIGFNKECGLVCEERLDFLWYLNCHIQTKFHPMDKLFLPKAIV